MGALLQGRYDYTEWVACLHGGENAYRHIEIVGTLAFVIADGQGYFIDGEEEERINYTDERTISSAVADDQQGIFAYALNEDDLFVIDQLFASWSVPMPFQSYTIKLEKIEGALMQVRYEEMTSGEFKTVWIDLMAIGSAH